MHRQRKTARRRVKKMRTKIDHINSMYRVLHIEMTNIASLDRVVGLSKWSRSDNLVVYYHVSRHNTNRTTKQTPLRPLERSI